MKKLIGVCLITILLMVGCSKEVSTVTIKVDPEKMGCTVQEVIDNMTTDGTVKCEEENGMVLVTFTKEKYDEIIATLKTTITEQIDKVKERFPSITDVTFSEDYKTYNVEGYAGLGQTALDYIFDAYSQYTNIVE